MGTKKYKPTSPGKRSRQVLDFADITQGKAPEKSLLVTLNKNSGRNNNGRITVRRRGGGVKRQYRLIDFHRNKDGIPATVKSVEYDPYRTANIALLIYADGEKRYILHPDGLKVGDTVVSGIDADIKLGNHLPLSKIPVGSIIHNIELTFGKGGQLARTAGAYATLQAKNNQYATVKLPSGEVRLIHISCRATMGSVGNSDVRNTVVGKAGASRWKRKRPKVRGSVMNPCDHPHGGGEGRAPVGQKAPRTPWGKPTLGYKTRKDKRYSDRFIMRKRK